MKHTFLPETWYLGASFGLTALQAGQKGVYIRRVEPTAPASSWLHEGDILMSFEGTDIANDGTVPFRSGERISFSYLISQKYTDEQVSSPSPPALQPILAQSLRHSMPFSLYQLVIQTAIGMALAALLPHPCVMLCNA
jgi:hypothetical protein